MSIFKKLFGSNGKASEESARQEQNSGSGEKREKQEISPDLMTGQLVAFFKKTWQEAYRKEYLRRLEFIGFSSTEATNMFMYESMILKQTSIERLCRPDYVRAWYFNLKNVLLTEGKDYYISHQAFLCSEITKIWDEAEWHYYNSHEKDLPDPVWKEIFQISRYGGGELFMEYLASMAEHTKMDISKLQQYSMAEQGLLFKYKWNPQAGEKHPYGCV
ncbi:MAG: hypothetical protein ACI3VB_06875 [Oscillospiraceae bacterium]